MPSKSITIKNIAAVCLALTSTLVVPGPSHAQPVPPRWTLKPGTEFYIRETAHRTESITIERRSSESKPQKDSREEQRISISKVRILAENEKQEIDLEFTLLDIQDSSGKSTEIGKRLSRAIFRLRLNANREVTRFEGYEEFVNRIAAGNLQFGRLLESLLSKQTLQQMIAGFLQTVPGPSDTSASGWTRDVSFSLGPLGSLNVSRKYIIQGPRQHLDQPMTHVTFEGKADYIPPRDTQKASNFKIDSGEIKIERLEGEAWFNPKTEQLVELNSHLAFQGDLEMNVGDDRASVSIVQSEQTRVEILDSNPLQR